ncbi:hypothetical protein EIN_119130 [Entamoeba invadens IP1]|uniref:EGF-like domain-containing protein n=1 Tax=Entamoeba invadens IP1 TaxID=370355 RepID=L7FNM3_ENTIV|nr:hypothetical protein EIN_119130 [Entamoeba invadens IP1]ELP92279.1 hypothetical protein EIN_119130 [Entamoeba invadens IP1]|eukprot:XP_004259050.1 hypothetical protein EIN_119130 [Entamoeba invadens IP1]
MQKFILLTVLAYAVFAAECTTPIENCGSCDEETKSKCVQCSDSYLLNLDNTCKKTCETGKITTETPTTCVKCTNEMCAVCSDVTAEGATESTEECTTCLGEDMYLNADKTCGKCETGMKVTETKKCETVNIENCDASTKTGETETCNKCSENNYLNQGACVSACPEGTILNEEKTECVAIPPQTCTVENCETCAENNNEVCVKCKETYYLDLTGKCGLDCPEGSKKDETNMKCVADTQTCTVENCETCAEGKTDVCAKCAATYYLSEGTCVTQCPEGTVKNDEKMECVADTPQICNVDNCDTCVEDRTDICNKCKSNYYLQVDQKSCATDCASGYKDTTNMKCVKCTTENCVLCSEDQKCTTCVDGNYLTEDLKCVTTCPEGYEANKETKKCVKITCKVENCKTCIETDINKCAICNDNLYVVEDTYKCVAKCDSGYKTDSTAGAFACKKCRVSNCAKCDSKVDECQQCSGDYYVKDGKCEKRNDDAAKSIFAFLALVAIFLMF